MTTKTSGKTKPRRTMSKHLAKMTEPLRGIYDQCASLVASLESQALLSRYRIGACVKRVMGDPAAYGAEAITQLATALDLSLSSLNTFKRLVEVWPSEETVRRLAERRTDSGRSIPFSYLELLTRDRISNKQRDSLIERFFTRGLTYEELRDIVRGTPGKTSNNDRGRAAGRTPGRVADHMLRTTKKFLDLEENWLLDMFDVLESEPERFASEELVEQLGVVHAELHRLGKESEAMQRRLYVIIDSLNRACEASVEAAAVKAARTPARTEAPAEAAAGVKKLKKKKKLKPAVPTGMSKLQDELAEEDASEETSPAVDDVLAAARGSNGIHKKKKKKLRTVSVG